MHAGDELELRFAEIGGDVRVGKGRTQRRGVRRGRELAVRPHAKAFLFNAPVQAAQRLGRQRIQSLLK